MAFLYIKIMDFIPKKINDYSARFTEHEPQLLAKLNRETVIFGHF